MRNISKFIAFLGLLISVSAFGQSVKEPRPANESGCTVVIQADRTAELYVQLRSILNQKELLVWTHPLIDRNARCPKGLNINVARELGSPEQLREHVGQILKVKMRISDEDYIQQSGFPKFELVSYSVAKNEELRKFGYLMIDADLNKQGPAVYKNTLFTDEKYHFDYMPIRNFETALERFIIGFSGKYVDSAEPSAVSSPLSVANGDRIRFLVRTGAIEDPDYVRDEWNKIQEIPWRQAEYTSVWGRSYVQIEDSSLWLVHREIKP